jgi:regulator of sigma E protease
VQQAVLKPAPIGTAVVFDREELPYQPESFGDAIALVNDAAYNLVVKSVQLIPRLFRSPEQGGLDANKSLTGPIGIFRELKARAELMGFDSFLKLVALVGLNLFIVNLLPIPITDGGQLLMLGVETAIRRPLPVWLKNGLMYLGVGLVGALFIYICGLDILRLFGIS